MACTLEHAAAPQRTRTHWHRRCVELEGGAWWCVFSIIPTHSFHTQTRTINDNPTPSSDSELRLHPRAVQIHHKRLVPVGHKPAKEGALLGRALDDDA